MTQWVVDNLGSDVPIHFSAFHPDWKMRDTPATKIETLIKAHEIAQKNGIHYAYTGNVHYETGDTTFCHQCGEKLIVRDWYTLKVWNLSAKGECPRCGEPCAGVFEEKPGSWGAKRQAVRLS